jgi:hypothetical protein
MGYEYELDHKYVGPPGVNSRFYGGAEDPYDDNNYHVRKGPKSKVKRNQSHPIQDLPAYFHVNYESLGDSDGYEIKSVIAPLMIHKILLHKLFRNVTFNASPNGYRNDGGIHVNVNRDGHTDSVAPKVFDFLHKTLPSQLAYKMSERRRDSYEMYSPQRPQSDYHSTYSIWGNHYNIINKENSNRFELRLFAAQKHLILPALEMADSLFTLAHDVPSISMENWTNFISSKLKYAHIKEHVRKYS